MHICYLNMQTEYYSPISGGAVATVTMQHVKELLRRGHRVTILSAVNGDPVYPAGDVVAINAPQRHELGAFPRAISKLRRKVMRWDAAYYDWYLRSFTKALKKLQPAPDIVVVHNDLISPVYVKRAVPAARVLAHLHNENRTCRGDIGALARSVEKFICVSSHVEEWTRQHVGIPAEKLVVLNNGVDLELFYPRVDYLEARQPLRVGFIGRIDPNKGPDIAADAVRVLRDEGHEIELSVAGGLWFYGDRDPMRDPYFQLLKEKMDLAGAAYLGHLIRPEVPDFMRAQDVTCVLSRSNDPNPLTVLEAMASGCTVIGSDRGGVPDACGGAGTLVNPDDLNAVINALRVLATDAVRLRAEKKKAVERARWGTWRARVDELEGIMGLGTRMFEERQEARREMALAF